MEVSIFLNMLMKAMDKVEQCYVFNDDNIRKIKREQVERSFAYEFYHQWSLLLKDYMKKNKSYRLFINGEIPKKLNRSTYIPDMIIHGDPTDLNHQFIVCEIKRKESITLDLHQYLKI